MSTKPLSQSDSSQNACLQKIFDSKLTDAVLITSALALAVIGALNHAGVLQFFGTTNSLYFAYGTYSVSSLLLLAEVGKIAINCTQTEKEIDVPKIVKQKAGQVHESSKKSKQAELSQEDKVLAERAKTYTPSSVEFSTHIGNIKLKYEPSKGFYDHITNTYLTYHEYENCYLYMNKDTGRSYATGREGYYQESQQTVHQYQPQEDPNAMPFVPEDGHTKWGSWSLSSFDAQLIKNVNLTYDSEKGYYDPTIKDYLTYHESEKTFCFLNKAFGRMYSKSEGYDVGSYYQMHSRDVLRYSPAVDPEKESRR